MKKNIKEYLDSIKGEQKKIDSKKLVKLMEEESGYKAVLHGKIIGFGLYHYVYDSGREGDGIVTGFSPRQSYISIYIMPGFSKYKNQLEKLGKHRIAKCCLYINKLSDVDEKILRKIIKSSVVEMKRKYSCRQA
ncbi:hypothetical protein NBRC116493_09150 [Aurantivibrio infirmus]